MWKGGMCRSVALTTLTCLTGILRKRKWELDDCCLPQSLGNWQQYNQGSRSWLGKGKIGLRYLYLMTLQHQTFVLYQERKRYRIEMNRINTVLSPKDFSIFSENQTSFLNTSLWICEKNHSCNQHALNWFIKNLYSIILLFVKRKTVWSTLPFFEKPWLATLSLCSLNQCPTPSSSIPHIWFCSFVSNVKSLFVKIKIILKMFGNFQFKVYKKRISEK